MHRMQDVASQCRHKLGECDTMHELIRTSDIVLIDVVRGILESERIPLLVADGQMSALEG